MLFVRIVLGSIVALATLGAIVSLGSIFSGYHLFFDLISHFRVQFIVLLIPALLVATCTRKTVPILIICLTLAVHGYAVAMSLLPESVNSDEPYVEVTALSSNVLLVNKNYQAQLDIIAAKAPDVIGFQEYTPLWHNELSTKLTAYPHRITSPEYGSFGIALYSKYPITNGGTRILSTKTFPTIDAYIDINGTQLRVMVVHPPPPSRMKLYWNRNQLMQAVALDSKAESNALLVMGDFNSTPWTTHFSDMTSIGKLRNARAGHGFHPTWPTPVFALSIPIDHILVNAKIGVEHFETVDLAGSDHRNIISRLRVY